MKEEKYVPILCVDFDGVIHSYTTPWIGPEVIPDPPVDGAFEWLKKATKKFQVCIYSSRSKYSYGIGAMQTWFKEHGLDKETLDKLEFPDKKPAAFLTIDDRCVCFEGTFPDPEELLEFKPWNKRDT